MRLASAHGNEVVVLALSVQAKSETTTCNRVYEFLLGKVYRRDTRDLSS